MYRIYKKGVKELFYKIIESALRDYEETAIEQNRCAMACQGCGAVFYFYLKRQ